MPVPVTTIGIIRSSRTVDDDLVVVDLGELDPRGSGPALDRRAFEDRYAELAFGLGTVPRRFHDDQSLLTRPGVLLFLAIVVIGALALGSASKGGEQRAVTGAATLPVLTARTHTQLVLEHVGRFTILDVDRGTLRDGQPAEPPPPLPLFDTPSAPIAAAAPDPNGHLPLVLVWQGRRRRVSDAAGLLGGGNRIVLWEPTQCRPECPIRATDAATGRTRTLIHYTRGSVGLGPIVVAPHDRAVALFENHVDGVRMSIVDLRHGGTVRADVGRQLPRPSAVTWSRDGRWLFAAIGADIVAMDHSGRPARVDGLIPPFESMRTG